LLISINEKHKLEGLCRFFVKVFSFSLISILSLSHSLNSLRFTLKTFFSSEDIHMFIMPLFEGRSDYCYSHVNKLK